MSCTDKQYLICYECKNYLSCGPVYIRKARNSVCGRCAVQNERGIRNRGYEISAGLLRFPCCYRNYGCQETQAFAHAFEFSHEYACDFRMYKCMFTEENEVECYWGDFKNKLISHCKVEHPDKLLNNCCRLTFDVEFPYQRTYLLIAFEMPFMLHVKVYVEHNDSKIIEFQLEFIGKQEAGAQFKFILNIQKGRSLFTRLGSSQVLTSTEVHINSLNDIFNGLEGVTYHLTVTVTCAICKKDLILGKLFNHGSYWLCENCSPHLKSCANKKQGCSFKDDSHKIFKHEKYFCPHAKFNTSFTMNVLDYGKAWLIKTDYEKVVLTTDIGFIVAEFTSMKTEGKYEIFIYTSLANEQGADFMCKVCIWNPYDNETLYLYPKFKDSTEYDWSVEVDRMEHPSWGSELAVLVLVQRIPIIPPINEDYF